MNNEVRGRGSSRGGGEMIQIGQIAKVTCRGDLLLKINVINKVQ